MNTPFFGPFILDDAAVYEPGSHQFLDALKWRCHRISAERIRRDPSLLRIPRENMARWLARDPYTEGEKRSLLEWQPLLDESRLDDLIALMTDPGEEGQRLRQSSPFVGIVTNDERTRIKREMIAASERHEKAAVS